MNWELFATVFGILSAFVLWFTCWWYISNWVADNTNEELAIITFLILGIMLPISLLVASF